MISLALNIVAIVVICLTLWALAGILLWLASGAAILALGALQFGLSLLGATILKVFELIRRLLP